MNKISNKTWDYLIMLTAILCIFILSTDYDFSHTSAYIQTIATYVQTLAGF